MELRPEITRDIIARTHEREKLLSKNATKDSDYTRRKPGKPESHIRPAFTRDADRILHSMAYTRYIDKTQVFYLVNNDHVTHRVLHVQLVSKVARTIGRSLGLNEDLIDAIALGHDIGHTPYGHVGEKILSDLCEENGIGRFFHNAQAIQFLDVIEDKNLTIQVLDGILSHDGEVHNTSIRPGGEGDWGAFDAKLERVREGEGVMPMTHEGCVVRFADNIAYLGRDLQDAIEINLIDEDIWRNYREICEDFLDFSSPRDVNRMILDTLIKDVINTSYERDEISFSEKASACVKKMKDLNYRYIYENRKLHSQDGKVRRMFEFMFDHFLHEYQQGTTNSLIFRDMIKPGWISEKYKESVEPAGLVRDYLAGMTDRYFNHVYRSLVIPEEIVTDFRARTGKPVTRGVP
jgi:dGTPase